MSIQFVYGTQAQYDAQVENNAIVEEGLYFINDTQRIYRGEELMSEQAPIKFTTEAPTEYEEDTLYVVTTTDDEGNLVRTIYVSDGETLEQVSSSNDSMTSDQVMAIINKLTVDNISDWEENASDDQLVTTAALKEILDWTLLSD